MWQTVANFMKKIMILTYRKHNLYRVLSISLPKICLSDMMYSLQILFKYCTAWNENKINPGLAPNDLSKFLSHSWTVATYMSNLITVTSVSFRSIDIDWLNTTCIWLGQHDGCWWLGAYWAPSHQQPSCWISYHHCPSNCITSTRYISHFCSSNSVRIV